MQLRESQWIGERLRALPNEDLFPLLDVGSSTLDYRTRVQPYIQEHIFDPLARRGGRVWHTDMKASPGIDLVGDLLDPAFTDRLRELDVRAVMICNILHHVTDRVPFARAVLDVVPSGGTLILSGAHRLPRVLDPIDTMFRPDIDEVAALFPGTDVLASAIIDSGNWRQWKAAERGGRSLGRMLARLIMPPIYRPALWWEVVLQSPYVFKHIQAFGLVLRKR